MRREKGEGWMCTEGYRDKGEKAGTSRQPIRWELISFRVFMGVLELCLGSAVPVALQGSPRVPWDSLVNV